MIHPTTGDVYVAGGTYSLDFPGTAGSPQPAYAGGILFDAFVARLSSTLTSLIQATYLGGNDLDEALALAIDSVTGSVYVAGHTRSNNFPGTVGGAQPAFGGGFSDAFVAQLPHTLTSLTQATYFGGTNFDEALALAIHPATGDVYVAGGTNSDDFPGTAGGAQPANSGGLDAFVVRLPRTLTTHTQATHTQATHTQATLLGGRSTEFAAALAIHPATGDVYVAGSTFSDDLPGTAGGAQPAFGGDVGDAFVARLPSTLTSLTQATYLGGSGHDVARALAIHPTTGDVYAAGHTDSRVFPGTAGGVQPAFGGNDVDSCVPDYFDGFVAPADVIFTICNGFVARLSRSLTTLAQATYLGGSGHDQAVALAIQGTTGDIYVGGFTSSIDFPGVAGGAQPVLSSGVFQTDAFVARLTFSLALVDPSLLLSASVNQPTFAVGQTLVAGGAVTNPGLPWSADFYVGILRPNGSILFFTSGGTIVGNVADLTSFRPLASAVPLGTPFTVTAPDFYTHQWTAGEPPRSYVFFVGAVKTGALATGTVTSDQILGLATAPFSFT